jgi:sec-independent protein translocase protein TatC
VIAKRKIKTEQPNDVMTLVDHLTELRKRLIVAAGVFLGASAICFFFASEIVRFIVATASEAGFALIYIAPAELITQYIRVAFLIGLVIASPVVLYEIWAFARPGMQKSESRMVSFSLAGGLLCFLIGGLFAYFVSMPLMLRFFISIDRHQSVAATITIQNYLSFVLSTVIIFGIIFEMPVITLLLSKCGLLKPEWLTKSRRMVIVAIFIIAAIITPSDVISQVVVAVPMMVLYEISVLLCKITTRRRRKELAVTE